MNPITYSFIIPHHNTPNLLKRCIDSIPQREDIEIIVADDNSQDNKKANIERSDVKIIYIDKEHTQGAGHARNVAMAAAKGTWLLFADADDYYTKGFLSILDKYAHSEYDVIYYNASSVYSDSSLPAGRTKLLNAIIENFDNSEDSIAAIKYRVHTPWNKMVKHEFIIKNQIVFEEVLQGNDTMFSFMLGYFVNNFGIEKEKLYVYTYTENSITSGKMNSNKHLCGWKNYFKKKSFLTFVGKKEWNLSLPVRLYRMYKSKSLKEAMTSIKILIANYSNIMREKDKYVKICLRHEI